MKKRKPKNPAKFDRCVKAVKKRGKGVNAYAVCTAAGTRGKKKGNRKKNPAANLWKPTKSSMDVNQTN